MMMDEAETSMIEDTPSSITGQSPSADQSDAATPTIQIDIENTAPDLWSDNHDWLSLIKRSIMNVMQAEKIDCPNGEISIVLTNDNNMRTLNLEHRGKDKSTNVLSFPGLSDDQLDAIIDGQIDTKFPYMFGDIVLAFETIETEAVEQKKSFEAHLCHLIVHGFLHLLGYDHIEDDEAEAMEERERTILANMNIADPYAYETVLEQ